MQRPKVTVGAIIEKEGRILLTKRNIKPFRNYWTFPGGHIELGETVVQTVKREVKEETGLTLVKPRFFCFDDEIFPKLGWYAVLLVFSGKARGRLKRQEEEVKEIRWFSKKEIFKLKLAFHHGQILKKIF